MSINLNYAQPVVVNGYACWNCHQVSEAKQGVNPATQGPFAVQASPAATAAAPGAASAQVTPPSALPDGANPIGYGAAGRLNIVV